MKKEYSDESDEDTEYKEDEKEDEGDTEDEEEEEQEETKANVEDKERINTIWESFKKDTKEPNEKNLPEQVCAMLVVCVLLCLVYFLLLFKVCFGFLCFS